jgi:REP element-mobilizing transposase RayT
MVEEFRKTHKRLFHYNTYNELVFLTWRLAFTLPGSFLQEIENKKRDFQNKLGQLYHKSQNSDHAQQQEELFTFYDEQLDRYEAPSISLTQSQYAKVLMDIFHFHEGKKYSIICYCIMSNHVHLLLQPLEKLPGEFFQLREIMHSLRSYSATKLNQLSHRKGTLWAYDFFDHSMRDEQNTIDTIKYILENPVKAGLVKQWEDWPWSYLNLDWNIF